MTRGTKGSHTWIPASFLLVGLLLVFLASDRRGAWLLLLWPALNCLLVGGAYFGPGGKVFGKRIDGSLPASQALLMLPFLTVLHATWKIQICVSGEDCHNEVSPGIFLGRRARPGEYPNAVTCVIDLTSEFSKPNHHPCGAEYLCLPTLDAFVAPDEDFFALVRKASAHERIFVHCANGHGRSAVFTAALLLEKGQAGTPDQALDMILKARPLCAINPVQKGLLGRFAGKA